MSQTDDHKRRRMEKQHYMECPQWRAPKGKREGVPCECEIIFHQKWGRKQDDADELGAAYREAYDPDWGGD
jgi:hypothetical protein